MTGEHGIAGFGRDRTLGEERDEDTARSQALHSEPRRERPVTIQRNLLIALAELQRRLDVYVRAYISLQEQAANHERTSTLLARARQEPNQLTNDLYQQQLSEKVRSLSLLKDELVELMEIAEQQLLDGIDKHDEVLESARKAMSILRRPGQDAAPMEAVGDVFTSIDNMGYAIVQLIRRCEEDARRLLGELGGVIGTIFELDQQKQLAARKRAPSVQKRMPVAGDTAARQRVGSGSLGTRERTDEFSRGQTPEAREEGPDHGVG